MDLITPEIITSFYQCKRKAFLTLNSSSPYKKTAYESMLENKAHQVKNDYCKTNHARAFYPGSLEDGVDLISDIKFTIEDYEFDCMALKKNHGNSNLGDYYYEPVIFFDGIKAPSQNLVKLAFLGYLLKIIQQRFPSKGIIVNSEKRQIKVHLERFTPELETNIHEIRDFSIVEPNVYLNRHCDFCSFLSDCRKIANKEGNISLLDKVSRKEIDKYAKKGIFNLTQLSYLYRPKKKNSKSKTFYTYKPELQALAIRTKKIYVRELPKIETTNLLICIDIESTPEINHYYLFGALLINDNKSEYLHFWSNSKEEELENWRKLLRVLSVHENVPVYHYGSFESDVFRRLSKIYGIDVKEVMDRMVNINQYIYGKIYFPTYSNKLKELAKYLGFKWQAQESSGIQSIVWRYYWEQGQLKYKEILIDYNRDDCIALSILVSELQNIQNKAKTLDNVDFADNAKKVESSISKNIHEQFDIALELAHSEYDRKKIQVDFDKNHVLKQTKVKGHKQNNYSWLGKNLRNPDKIIVFPPDKYCFIHKKRRLNKSNYQYRKVKLDLKFSKNGVKKTIIEYIGQHGHCPICNNSYAPLEFREISKDLYGHNFKSWVVFQRVEIQLSFSKINESLYGIVNEKIGSSSGVEFIRQFSERHKETEDKILNGLLIGQYIHVDETTVSISGTKQYVWVLTNGKYTILTLTANRETLGIKELLKDYTGILISDFYAGYDSVDCVQQKCWVHLLRDLNNDLWKNPFDKEYENFVSDIRNLIIPILETFYRHGLKQYFFRKHERNVERFYNKTIDGVKYNSDLCSTYQKRFKRYKDSLFTFLRNDDITWHNNVAENRIRHICVQRKISGSFGPNQFPHYLRMLGIMHTCKQQKKSFLGFLLSQEKDIDYYKDTKRIY